MDYSLVLMTSQFNSVEDLVGQSCTHGSPGYPVNEIIAYIGQTDETGVRNPIWKIEFASGCFTYIFQDDLYELVLNGKVEYQRAKHFDAMEEIHLIESEKDWE